MTKTPTTKKVISVYVAVSLLINSIFPTYIKATTGPSAPEFSSFEPVSSNGMVSEFSGDFSYNLPILSIPGVDGGGYALSLSYKNTSPEDDASWVGYGWTLSPGAIIRSKNGFPDDVNGAEMTSYNEIPRNWTIGLGVNLGITVEGFSISGSVGELLLLQYNNHQGYSYTAIPNIGVGIGYGVISLGLSLQDGEGSFSAQVNPAKAMSFLKQASLEKSRTNEGKMIYRMPNTQAGKQEQRFANASARNNPGLNAFISYATDNSSRNTNISAFTAASYKLSVGVQFDPVGIPIGGGADMFGTYSYQDAETSTIHPCYGYLYSANATDADALMDYYTEKDQGFNKRDYYLSIPYARPDQFLLMGEGLGGGFRAFSKKAGHFKTNEVENSTELIQIGVDIMLGADVGLGGSGQTGEHSITSGDWDDEGENNDYNFSNDGDESFYMSFMMDAAQNMSFGGDEIDLQAQNFSLKQTNGTPGFKSYIPTHPSALKSSVDTDEKNNHRIPRSSQVIYHTNLQMSQEDQGGNPYNRYTNENADYETYLNRNDKLDQIGEFVVYNNSGNQYVYGLPVYSQKESSFSYDISSPSKDYILTEDISTYERKVGDSTGTPYATSWLLTSIVSPNYIDRKMDGPTEDDFGGWTKFNYAKKYGYNADDYDNNSDNDTWYKWRVPYNGLYNNPGSLSDDGDDMGSFSSGEKEVYYVESIETKTHIATFYKSNRADGYDAAGDEAAASSFIAQGSNFSEKLDSIYLYSKNDLGGEGEVIKRIYFSYDYSLMPNHPSNSGKVVTVGATDLNENKGVLTLKKVWFEYGTVRNAKISPYEFSYEYPTIAYPPKYNSIDSFAFGTIQNPDYDRCNVDRWGNYQYNGAERLNTMNPWIDQKIPSADFDPAAWQLKSIVLPTGGEIHVQYEADDYLYVQDRRAMAMVSLSSIIQPDGSTSGSELHPEGNLGDKFYLNLNDIGIAGIDDIEERADLISLMKKQFIDGEAGKEPEKIYFKFLYSLLEDEAGLDKCGSEYITGYVDVAAIISDGDEIYLQLGSEVQNPYMEITDDDETYSIPRQVCIDFYDKTRVGNINEDGCPDHAIEEETGGDDKKNAEEAIYNLLGEVSNVIVENHHDLCLDIDESNSYLRIPVLKSKKGGGLRVKRILMYDAGLEANDATLNGKVYMYKNTDGLTSGVATNEPSQGRDENALVKYLDVRKDSDFLTKAISGEDLEQYEGPIGEGLLPGGSVGYSRVVTKNIHTDQNTNDGFSTSEFYTTYDYPFDGHYSYYDANNIDKVIHNGVDITSAFSAILPAGMDNVSYDGVEITGMDEKSDFMAKYLLVYNQVVSNIWASQGYRFIVNDMNGKPKKNAVYSGDYANINNPDSVTQVSGIEYTYYEPLEPVPVVDRWEWIDDIGMTPEYRVLGKQMDVVTESRAIQDHLNDITLEIDGSIGIWGLFVIPWITAMVYKNETENELYTHVTNKVIYAPTQLKSMRKYQDGIYVDTYNAFFDANTGEAMVNITNDGFNKLELESIEHDGRYVNYSFPAAHYYDGTAVRSITDGYHVEKPGCFYKEGDAGITTLIYDVANCGISCAMAVFTPGDLVALTDINGVVELYNVGEVIGNSVTLLPNGDYYHDNTNSQMADVTIVNTARKNQLGAKVGGLTTYGGYPNVSSVTIDQAIIDARNEVADALTAMIAEDEGTVEAALNFPDVSIIDDEGNCVPLNSTAVGVGRAIETIVYPDNEEIITWVEEECIYPFDYPQQWKVSNDSVVYNRLCISNLGDNNCDNAGFYVGGEFIYCQCATCWDADTTVISRDKLAEMPMIEVTLNGCTITFTYVQGYEFYIDPASGELMYGDSLNPCDAVLVECFDFCPNEFPSVELDKVVASSATWLSDKWGLTSDLKNVHNYNIPGSDLNDYETGAKGHWLGKYTYDYNTSLSDIEVAGANVWNTGIYGDFTVFNWDYGEANDSVWTLLNTTTSVSPNTVSLEEINALGIYSSLKMGYDFAVPYLKAANSPYENVMFESFETVDNSFGTNMICEDGYVVSLVNGYVKTYAIDTAHAGKQSLRMEFLTGTSSIPKTTTYESKLILQKITLDDQTINKGVSVKLWMKSDKTLSELSLLYSKSDMTPTGITDASVSFNKIAQTGEWALYEAKITDFGPLIIGVLGTVTPTVYIKSDQLQVGAVMPTAPKLYIDDIKMQPIDAQVAAYVYDPETLRLLASFDEQHFALFYKYSQEGKLVRKSKETVEGVKTISETQYNMPKSARP